MPLRRPIGFAVAALFVAALSFAGTAGAEPKVYETDPIRIALKPARPLVTELATPQKDLASAQSKQPVASRIEAAVTASPF